MIDFIQIPWNLFVGLWRCLWLFYFYKVHSFWFVGRFQRDFEIIRFFILSENSTSDAVFI